MSNFKFFEKKKKFNNGSRIVVRAKIEGVNIFNFFLIAPDINAFFPDKDMDLISLFFKSGGNIEDFRGNTTPFMATVNEYNYR